MLASLHHLLGATLRHWYQLLGGTTLAVVGLLGDINGWSIPGWVWGTLAYAMLLWAIASAYHDLRVERDAAVDGLNERRDLQAIADTLTTAHHTGVHDIGSLEPRSDASRNAAFREVFKVWFTAVKEWNATTKESLERSHCTAQEVARFWTIHDVEDKARMVYADDFELAIYVHHERLRRLWELIEDYSARAKAAPGRRDPTSSADHNDN